MPTKMKDISTPHQEQYRTDDGNVFVTKFKPGAWQVMPRGHAPFLVGSKREAFEQAVGIATRHWGLPKEEAFPPRKRSHATKKSPAQLQREINEVLAKPAGKSGMAVRLLYSSADAAKRVAAAINRATKSFDAGYKRLDDRTYRVEVENLPLAEVMRILKQSRSPLPMMPI